MPKPKSPQALLAKQLLAALAKDSPPTSTLKSAARFFKEGHVELPLKDRERIRVLLEKRLRAAMEAGETSGSFLEVYRRYFKPRPQYDEGDTLPAEAERDARGRLTEAGMQQLGEMILARHPDAISIFEKLAGMPVSRLE
jgi:LAS superfamily LD-carboxypeptidase LdcB